MVVICLVTAAFDAAPEEDDEGELDALIRMNATTMAMTATTLPPVISIRLRISARRAAARCAAIFSLAFCCLILVALLMPALPHPSGFLWPDSAGPCRGFHARRTSGPAHGHAAAGGGRQRPC